MVQKGPFKKYARPNPFFSSFEPILRFAVLRYLKSSIYSQKSQFMSRILVLLGVDLECTAGHICGRQKIAAMQSSLGKLEKKTKKYGELVPLGFY